MIAFIGLARKELFRKKIMIIALVLTGLFLVSFAYGLSLLTRAAHPQDASLGQNYINGLLLLYFGLFFIELISGFFVFFLTMGAISGDIENGILLSLVPRPMPRWKYYAGKWLGYAFWSVLYSAVLYGFIFLIVHQILGFPLTFTLFIHGLWLFALIPLCLLSLSMLGSVLFPMLGNGIFCAMLFVMSIFIGFLNNLMNHEQVHLGVMKISMIVNMLLPANAVFQRITYDMINISDIPGVLLDQLGPFSHATIINNLFLIYVGAYIVAMVGIGSLLFTKKDL